MEVQGVGIGYTLPSRGTWLRFIYNPLITHMVSRGATEPDPASIHSGPSDFREGIAWTSMLKPLETPGGGGGGGKTCYSNQELWTGSEPHLKVSKIFFLLL